MEELRDWGNTTITASDLTAVINNGGVLLNRPGVVTLNDGYADVCQIALSIKIEWDLLA